MKPPFVLLATFSLFLGCALAVSQDVSGALDVPQLRVSKVLLTNVPSYALLILPAYEKGESWPVQVPFEIQREGRNDTMTGILHTRDPQGGAVLLHTILLPKVEAAGHVKFVLRFTDRRIEEETYCIPGWLSLLPIFLTPVLCVVARHVLIGLIASTWVCASLAHGDPAVGFLRTCDTYLVNTINTMIHVRIVVFMLVVAGVMGIIQKSGGVLGLGLLLRKAATSHKRGQCAMLALVAALNADDRTAMLAAGHALRGVMNSIGVSPERSSCILHTTAVCVSSLLPVTTWGAVQLGFISGQYQALDLTTNPFIALLKTLPYRFFPIACLVAVGFMIAVSRNPEAASGRKRGSGLSLSDDAEDGGGEEPAILSYDLTTVQPIPSRLKPRAVNALLPLFALLVGAPIGMWINGLGDLVTFNQAIPSFAIPHVFSNYTEINALIWAAMTALVLGVTLAVTQRLLTVEQAVVAWLSGVQNAVHPLIIIMNVWGLGLAITDVHLADYLSHGMSDLPKAWLPVLSFVTTAIVSYVSGSGCASLGLLFPALTPFAFTLGGGDEGFVVQVMSGMFSGCVAGDLCSPLAEATSLSSAAVGCPVRSHTAAQVQFIGFLLLLTLLTGTIPVSLGWYHLGVGLALSCGLVATFVFAFGRDRGDEGYFLPFSRSAGGVRAPLLDTFSSRQRAVNSNASPPGIYISDSDSEVPVIDEVPSIVTS